MTTGYNQKFKGAEFGATGFKCAAIGDKKDLVVKEPRVPSIAAQNVPKEKIDGFAPQRIEACEEKEGTANSYVFKLQARTCKPFETIYQEAMEKFEITGREQVYDLFVATKLNSDNEVLKYEKEEKVEEIDLEALQARAELIIFLRGFTAAVIVFAMFAAVIIAGYIYANFEYVEYQASDLAESIEPPAAEE